MNVWIRTSFVVCLTLINVSVLAANLPMSSKNGMVVSGNAISSEIGIEVLREGGGAVDAAVATAFALAVTSPSGGNIGGGGFLVYRSHKGDAIAYDFRELAPSGSHPNMWLVDGQYSYEKHHLSPYAVGVPGTVKGLHLAWRDHGRLPWKRLVEPAIKLAEEGITVTLGLARSLEGALPRMKKYPASMAQFSNKGKPFEAGHVLKQIDLANTLQRIANKGPDGFYKGKTATLIVKEIEANGGLITLEDLANYKAKRRVPIKGNYRGYDIISMPPPSSGGTALVEMLNILEGFNLAESGFGTRVTLHRMTEAMRRAYHDRARFMGDPDFNDNLPLVKLTSKKYAAELRNTIDPNKASVSNPESFSLPKESPSTTHFSVVDKDRNAVSLTYTLECGYGSGIVVSGAGFLLNNQMGDFNAGPGLTNSEGLIGTPANLAEPGKRMLSSMTPTILAKDGELFMVSGAEGGRTIINTVLQTILNVIDHKMNAQAAVDAGRFHHQWLPDVLSYEHLGFSRDSIEALGSMGHEINEVQRQGYAEVIVVNPEEKLLEGGVDRREPDGGVSGY
ncbi:MAG: gamma-glutamyltransferase [Gammaproteobacteria bacterium]|nr:gamma-glutamyltransferase [Gammaproteobacteria bacterium]